MFEKASKLQLRFPSTRGKLTTEDLWRLTIDDLKAIGKPLNKKLKEEDDDEDFGNTTKVSEELSLQVEILKHIIKAKESDKAAHANKVAKRAQQEKLLNLIAEKRDKALGEKSVEELEKELLALEDQ